MEPSSTTMTDQFSLSLRAWPAPITDREALPFLISRINEQRGSFRHVTENSLGDEIQNAGLKGEVPGDTDDSMLKSESADGKTKREEVMAARDEILKRVAQAQVQSSYALDFISLLLSKSTPRQAELSMSTFLKQQVPMGSLGAEIVQLPNTAESTKANDKMISTGWKLQSLNAAADSLLQSATRLEKEMEQEATYWEQVLAVKERGWSLSRLPREKHTLSVRYGFAEAAAEFRDRGLAALRRGEGGIINLDLGLNAPARRVLRSRTQHQGRIIASSQSVLAEEIQDHSIESTILQARNHIFDEELYYELLREARKMTNRGIKCTTDLVILSLEDDKQILLDLVSPETLLQENSELTQRTIPTGDHLPDIVVSALRILLCHAHRENLKRRSQPPQPLTERRVSRPVYSILRPILALLQHQNSRNATFDLLNRLRKILAHADITLEIKELKSPFDAIKSISNNLGKDLSIAEALLDLFSSPLLSTITLSGPSAASTMQIHLRNHSIQGTEYKVNMGPSNESLTSHIPRESNFVTAQEVEDHVLRLLTLDLVTIISSETGVWEVSTTYDGKLTTEPDEDGCQKTILLSLLPHRLKMTCYRIGGKGEDSIEFHEWFENSSDDQGLLSVTRRFGAGDNNKRP